MTHFDAQHSRHLRYVTQGVSALHDTLQDEWNEEKLWPSPEEMEKLIDDLDYLIPKDHDGSYKYNKLKCVRI